ncbi:MauE/DoxX family redox-associated membrane protein [uncultured Paludibaculum sp.]|uniref:MauE/DoxX family redox-associated membrane protein n=1 Tax=uncultured Paludibaculum sp. TaxID=1765020 RepID=UPI002AAA7160|nr:MauE/DoxX family redox-associated membrane protein [uncultured Paludibaculum sp.]
MAHGAFRTPALQTSAWQYWFGTVSAFLLALLFLVAGIWKLSDPLATETRMVQALIPTQLALATALAAGIAEIWSGVMLIVPRWRKWGAWLSGLMLLAFMVYFAVFYQKLQGADCSCFPWLKRVVGPGFFISDAVMLALAVIAGRWADKSSNLKQAAFVLAAIVVFAGAVYGITAARQTGAKAPAEITVDGKAFATNQGRVFLFFFDPECMHCFAAAQQMSKYGWTDVKVIVVPTVHPQWSESFLKDTGLKAGVSPDVKVLRQTFAFSTDPPYGVALERGRQVAAFPFFDDKDPVAGLKKLGWLP